VQHLKSLGYKNNIPKAVPMLTRLQKKNRLLWAKKHLKDNWGKTFFTDETAFQLSRNTTGQWYKGSRLIKPVSKNREKYLRGEGLVEQVRLIYSILKE
jgi:hypothetical protein